MPEINDEPWRPYLPDYVSLYYVDYHDNLHDSRDGMKLIAQCLKKNNLYPLSENIYDWWDYPEGPYIEEFLEEIEPEDGWTDGAINDFFWFDFDTLTRHLGYKDEEDFDMQHSPNYVDDDELAEYAEKWFREFVQKNHGDYELLKAIADQFGVGQTDEEWEMYEDEDSVADYVIRCYENNDFCLMEYLFDEDDSGHEYVDDRIPTTMQLRKWAMVEKKNNNQTEQQ